MKKANWNERTCIFKLQQWKYTNEKQVYFIPLVPFVCTPKDTTLDWGGVYTRTILRKTFLKAFTLFNESHRLHWFVSYAKNGLNKYGSTSSLVSVGWGSRKVKKKSRAEYESYRFRTVFAVYMRKTKGTKWYRFWSTCTHAFVSGFQVAVFIVHFHRISVNEQPKR